MRLSLITFLCAIMSILFGVLMLVPCTVSYMYNDIQDARTFFICALGVIFTGMFVCGLSYRQWTEKSSLKEMFIMTSSVWIVLCFLAALPFYFSTVGMSFTDAVFESVSGLTTTGATVLSHIDDAPKGFLLWRSMIQWIGGIGIVILAITLLPILRIGGMQLFTTESSDSSEKETTSIASKLKLFIFAYLFLSCACTFCFWLFGMDLFDAIAHMMTCISTGGFSTHDASMGYFQSKGILWSAVVFMAIGGIPLAVIVYFLAGKWKKMTQDSQTRTYLITLFVLIVPVALIAWAFGHVFPTFMRALEMVAFHVVSIMTTTGYIYENYAEWGPFFVMFFFLLTACGACTGSTSGGIKIFRFSILAKAIKRHLTLMTSPHAIVIPQYNDRPVTDDVMLGVASFFTIFLTTVLVCSLCLSITGLDFMTSISASLTSVANVGPGMGNLIGPDQNFFILPASAKWWLSFAMLLGRLEFMTILVLFLPKLWVKK